MNDEAKAFAQSAIKGVVKPKDRIRALVQQVFSRSDLNLLYRAEANTVAMFHNNNGADALLKKDYIKAYAYFRSAFLQSPDMSSVLANLGYLYRLTGHYELAERTYLRAIKKDKNNLTAWRNLSYLYRYMGHDEKANDIVDRVSRKRADNPFFHINRGDNAFEKQQWKIALRHYQRALRLDKSTHEVFFSLGKTYFELGNIKWRYHYLQLAKKTSRTQQEQDAYQLKIDLLATIKSG